MKKVCFLLLILNIVVLIGCTEQPPKQLPKLQGHQKKAMKTEVDLIKKYDHEIRDYYRELAEVGLDGVTVMDIDKQVEYTDLAIELIMMRSKEWDTSLSAMLKHERLSKNIITLISLKITSIWQGTNFVDMYSKMELLKNGWNSERLWR